MEMIPLLGLPIGSAKGHFSKSDSYYRETHTCYPHI